MTKNKYQVDSNGFYGDFGGAFIPEMLYHNMDELNQNYLKIIKTVEFQKEFHYLLKDYVGRPSPLFFAENLSKKYQILELIENYEMKFHNFFVFFVYGSK